MIYEYHYTKHDFTELVTLQVDVQKLTDPDNFDMYNFSDNDICRALLDLCMIEDMDHDWNLIISGEREYFSVIAQEYVTIETRKVVSLYEVADDLEDKDWRAICDHLLAGKI